MILSLAGNQLFSKTSYMRLSLNSIQPHFFHAKNFQIHFLLQTWFEWAHGVDTILVAMLSVCVCVCVCLITMLALFLCLKQPFTGINIQAKSQLGSPEEQLSTIMYPPSSVLNHQEKNSSVLSVLGFGMKAGIF